MYSDYHRRLESHEKLVDDLALECGNYVRLLQVLQKKELCSSFSSLMQYVVKKSADKGRPILRIESKPGEIARMDFGSVGRIFDEISGKEIQAYVFVMVLEFFRDAYYEFVRSQDIKTWCLCHIHAFEHFGGVPRIIIPDNLKARSSRPLSVIPSRIEAIPTLQNITVFR